MGEASKIHQSFLLMSKKSWAVQKSTRHHHIFAEDFAPGEQAAQNGPGDCPGDCEGSRPMVTLSGPKQSVSNSHDGPSWSEGSSGSIMVTNGDHSPLGGR